MAAVLAPYRLVAQHDRLDVESRPQPRRRVTDETVPAGQVREWVRTGRSDLGRQRRGVKLR